MDTQQWLLSHRCCNTGAGRLPPLGLFLEIFLCLVTYLYIMGLVSGQRLTRAAWPAGGWLGWGWQLAAERM